jgi:hypothetical protein
MWAIDKFLNPGRAAAVALYLLRDYDIKFSLEGGEHA